MSLPPGAEELPTFGDAAIELAEVAGLHLDPWQQLVLREALRHRVDGKWAAFEVGLVVPRQNGKGSILEALELAALFLPDPSAPPPLILHSAHEFKTSAEHFRRVRYLVENCDLLKKQVRIIRTASGAEAIELHNGGRLRFVTRSGGSGRGFSADLVVIDEAYNLAAESLAAILPTLSARDNPQIWYTSSAGMESSTALATTRRRGHTGGDRTLAYFEWCAPEKSNADDVKVWAVANPGMGYRLTPEFISAEREAMREMPGLFERERLGIWPIASTPPALDYTKWRLLKATETAEKGSPVFGLATHPDREWAAIAAAWYDSSGRAHVSIGTDYRPGTAWVEDRMAELRRRYSGTPFVDIPSRGILKDVNELSQQDQAKAHNALSDGLEAGNFVHYDEPALNTSVRGAVWKSSGDTRVLDPRGDVDISPLRAAALALWGLRTASTPQIHEWPDDDEIARWEAAEV